VFVRKAGSGGATNNQKSGSDKIVHPVNVVGESQALKPTARTPTTANSASLFCPFFSFPTAISEMAYGSISHKTQTKLAFCKY